MKRVLLFLSLLIILACGITGVSYAWKNVPITYDGSDTNVLDLYENPSNGDVSDPDGVADIMVQQNLSRTMAANNVAAIVFDIRGFDTLGESFILLTAIAGSYVILNGLRKAAKEKGGKSDEV